MNRSLALLARRPGPCTALLPWEATGVVAALAKPGLRAMRHQLVVAVAGTHLVLVRAAAATLPSPELPSR